MDLTAIEIPSFLMYDSRNAAMTPVRTKAVLSHCPSENLAVGTG